MKRKYVVFRKQSENADLPQDENLNEDAGAGNAETSGANEQADASRGEQSPEDKNREAREQINKNRESAGIGGEVSQSKTGTQQTEGPDL